MMVVEPALHLGVMLPEMALGLLQKQVHVLPAEAVNFDLALDLLPKQVQVFSLCGLSIIICNWVSCKSRCTFFLLGW